MSPHLSSKKVPTNIGSLKKKKKKLNILTIPIKSVIKIKMKKRKISDLFLLF